MEEKKCPNCGRTMIFDGNMFRCPIRPFSSCDYKEDAKDVKDSFEHIFYDFLKLFNRTPFITNEYDPHPVMYRNEALELLEKRSEVLIKKEKEGNK